MVGGSVCGEWDVPASRSLLSVGGADIVCYSRPMSTRLEVEFVFV